MRSLNIDEVVVISGGQIGGGSVNGIPLFEVGQTGMNGTGYTGNAELVNKPGCGAAVNQAQSTGSDFAGPIGAIAYGGYTFATDPRCTTGWVGGEGRPLEAYIGPQPSTPSDPDYPIGSI